MPRVYRSLGEAKFPGRWQCGLRGSSIRRRRPTIWVRPLTTWRPPTPPLRASPDGHWCMPPMAARRGCCYRACPRGWLRLPCVADDSPHFPRTGSGSDRDRRRRRRPRPRLHHGRDERAGRVRRARESPLQWRVAREVHEEVGVSVDQVEYLGDQPLAPSPSLMVGFRAHATSSTALSLRTMRSSRRWFTRGTGRRTRGGPWIRAGCPLPVAPRGVVRRPDRCT